MRRLRSRGRYEVIFCGCYGRGTAFRLYIDGAKRRIAQENETAKYSGMVDKRVLHRNGQRIQNPPVATLCQFKSGPGHHLALFQSTGIIIRVSGVQVSPSLPFFKVFEPLFSLNHTCAMIRDGLGCLVRRTRYTSKSLEMFKMLLAIYVDFHSRVLTPSV